jgi:soluble lytic murein transglycosylase-like protein
MITLGLHSNILARALAHCRSYPPNGANVLIRFCFILILSSWLSAALFAANPERPRRITSVVRPDLRTGKLVRSMIVSPQPVAERKVAGTIVQPRVVSSAAASEPFPPSGGLDEAVERIAREHSLSPQLIHSVIRVESNYNPYAVSSKGALGLMQLIPATARRFGVSDVFNPIENIQGGARYLRYLLDLYADNYPLALAAYNAGEGAVAKHGGVPPFAETRNYLTLVRKQLELARLELVKRAAAARPVAAGPIRPVPQQTAEPGPAHILEVVQPDGAVRYVSQ